jgi:hypothetical protein
MKGDLLVMCHLRIVLVIVINIRQPTKHRTKITFTEIHSHSKSLSPSNPKLQVISTLTTLHGHTQVSGKY